MLAILFVALASAILPPVNVDNPNPAVVPGEMIVSTTTNLSGQVLTPFGFRPSSMIHEIGPGNALNITDGHVQEIGSTGKVLANFGPSGVNVSLMPGNISSSFGLPTNGWVTDAKWIKSTGGIPIDSFKTTWVVPPAPATSSGQTIYLFNGIVNPGYILQPVLGWINGQWSLTSWYADGATGLAFYTSSVQVTPGETLYGVITRTVLPPEMGKWEYICQFQGKPQTTLHVRNIDELTDFYETLEVYDVTKCSDYPATDVTAFKEISINDHNGASPTVSWAPEDYVDDCGQYTKVISSAEVDIHYHKQIALRAAANNKYVCAENGGNLPLIANRDGIGSWETFGLIDLGNNKVALLAVNGKYVCAENGGNLPLIANRNGIGSWETFDLINLGNNNIALKAVNGKYVCAENGGNLPLIANRNGIGSWETFGLIDLNPGSTECTGEVCGSIQQCDSSCGQGVGDCFLTTEGNGKCLEDWPCSASYAPCTSSADCGNGVCVTDSCCGYNECRPVSSFCTVDLAPKNTEKSIMPHDGPTGASLGPNGSKP
jgi:hypothetical protein